MLIDDDRPGEECGVIGAVSTDTSVTESIVEGLYALQHRGQDAAGITIADKRQVMVVKDTGLVSDVLTPQTVGFLEGKSGIGHTRYSTTGDQSWENAQPCFRTTPSMDFAVAHNGNLVGVPARTKRIGDRTISINDTELIADRIVGAISRDGSSFEDAVFRTMAAFEGAFCLVILTPDGVIGVRDPNGFRPMCLGSFESGWALASETSALDTMGATFVREVLPGEMVILTVGESPRSRHPFPENRINSTLCMLEYVYLARPDSYLGGTSVHSARIRMGIALARRSKVAADLVIGVPESGIPASEGFSRESGIPWSSGLVKNRYSGRSFINHTQASRDRAVRRKLSTLREEVNGKRLVVVDDSVIRGTVTRRMVQLLRDAGALEVHLRVALPPVRWPCFYGVDIGSRKELIAVGRTVSQMTDVLGVDSLDFLTVKEIRAAIGDAGDHTCTCCITGEYPLPFQ